MISLRYSSGSNPATSGVTEKLVVAIEIVDGDWTEFEFGRPLVPRPKTPQTAFCRILKIREASDCASPMSDRRTKEERRKDKVRAMLWISKRCFVVGVGKIYDGSWSFKF